MRLLPSYRATTVFMLLVFLASWIKPLWPVEQALHSSLTVLGFAALWWYRRRYVLSERDYLLIAVFIATHCIAARWLYSNVPYDHWAQSALGVSLNQLLGWQRNNFDRLVHFLYGFCLTPPIAAHVVQRYRQSGRFAFGVAITAIMVTSLWYEWFEWLIAVTLSPTQAEAYNGQQGDMWDAHKDMLTATLGSLLWWLHYRRQRGTAEAACTT
ncbi:putative membrane protein [Andreprevotia lacus DSM 23236]|jgi:putative membrane protein|uniref:Putative membrane protein n=1 Tax=Andreprevotia lacus DSM 23236 TaxID=1121001 RepID=A0A1W1XRY6_9NEIS|nr:DUF2238 domain-containing protein [Andreprevotia lacus]SMC26656.1 putative membrane protein [Andreprevotia lacus DSM 23236]